MTVHPYEIRSRKASATRLRILTEGDARGAVLGWGEAFVGVGLGVGVAVAVRVASLLQSV
jgi:hypothetical protein